MLNRRPSDALLLIATVAVIALVLVAVMALERMTVHHDATVGSLGTVLVHR